MGLPCRVPAIRGVLCAVGGSAAAAGTRTPGGQRDYQRETAVRESWSLLESGQTRLLEKAATGADTPNGGTEK